MTVNDRIKNRESFLVANDGQFIGKLSLNRYDSESILNTYGLYGSSFSAKSIYNEYSVYGSRYSALSPFNPYTATPPKIYLRGSFWGLLTSNLYLYSRKITPMELNNWMVINGLY